jgi:molybdate transport system ATP-binding protein
MNPVIDAKFYFRRGSFTLDVDFCIPARGVCAVFGASGCGKTTLLRAIAGLEANSNGRLQVADMRWQQGDVFVPPHQRALGYVFQESSLFAHLNVRRNLEYGLKRVAVSERKVSLEQAIHLLGIESLLERQPHSLSGGEKQRVAIARALAVSPRLLLMDEPLAALDQSRKQEVMPYLKALHQELDIPVMYVSHALEEVAQLADYLILMEAGGIVATGDIHELFTRLDLPLAQELDASAIINARVAGFDEAFQLMHLQFGGGRMSVPVQNLKKGDEVRLRLMARDVSLTLEHQSGTSILNIFPVTVSEIAATGAAQVSVKLDAAGVSILSRITRKSAQKLNLTPGKKVFAQVKSVALLA